MGTHRTAVCSQVNKLVGNRIIRKRIHVRTEHVSHSKCRQDFLDRVQANDAKRQEAREKKGEGTERLRDSFVG